MNYYLFFMGIIIGAGLAAIVFLFAYINLTKDVRREQERLRETRERLTKERLTLVASKEQAWL